MRLRTDDLLAQLGSPGRYQIFIFILLALSYFPIVYNHVIMAFFGGKFPYSCDPNAGNYTMYAGVEQRKCEIELFGIDGINKTHICDAEGQWAYKKDERESTIVTEWDLVCDKEDLGNLATTIYFLGVMVGGVVFGYIADKFGRKPVIIITIFAPIALGLGIRFAPTYAAFVILRFILGIFMQGLQTATYILVMEYFKPKDRGIAGAILEVFWGIAVMSLAGITYLIKDWRDIQLAICLPSIVAIVYIFFIPESLRWLVMEGKTKKAETLVNRIASFNKMEVPKETWEIVKMQSDLMNEDEKRQFIQTHSFIDMLRTPQIRKRSLILFYCWFVISCGYYGLTFRISDLAGNRYLNFFIGGAVETVAYAIVIFVVTIFGRRKPFFTYFMIAGISCIIAGAIPTKNTDSSIDFPMMATGFAIVGRFGMGGLFSVAFLYTAELYPTVIRNIGLGTCASFARLGGVVAPQVNTLGRHTSSSVPIIIFGSLAVIGGCLSLMLPETLGTKLADSIDDAENLSHSENRADDYKESDTPMNDIQIEQENASTHL